MHESEITFIAVGTPFDGQRIDLSYIREAARQIGAALRNKAGYHVVVVKSTVVPGTTDEVVLTRARERAPARRPGVDFGVGMNPEFLTEGVAVDDFMRPDRIVLGGIDERTIEAQREVYAAFADTPTLATNNKTAEMIKYTSNSVLATMISFSNEIGNLCSALGGVDVADVMRGVHLARYFSAPQPDGRRVQAPHQLVPVGRLRLRRQLPAEGHQGAVGAWRVARGADAAARRGDLHQPSPAGADDRRCLRKHFRRWRAARSPCSALRSRKTPTTCASRRRSRSRGCW